MSQTEKMYAVHVVPQRDAVDHQDNDDCLCGPQIDFLDDDTPDTFRFQHHRLERAPGGWTRHHVVQQNLPELDRERESGAG